MSIANEVTQKMTYQSSGGVAFRKTGHGPEESPKKRSASARDSMGE